MYNIYMIAANDRVRNYINFLNGGSPFASLAAFLRVSCLPTWRTHIKVLFPYYISYVTIISFHGQNDNKLDYGKTLAFVSFERRCEHVQLFEGSCTSLVQHLKHVGKLLRLLSRCWALSGRPRGNRMSPRPARPGLRFCPLTRPLPSPHTWKRDNFSFL